MPSRPTIFFQLTILQKVVGTQCKIKYLPLVNAIMNPWFILNESVGNTTQKLFVFIKSRSTTLAWSYQVYCRPGPVLSQTKYQKNGPNAHISLVSCRIPITIAYTSHAYDFSTWKHWEALWVKRSRKGTVVVGQHEVQSRSKGVRYTVLSPR